MKKIIISFICMSSLLINAQENFFSLSHSFFESAVHQNKVDYASIKSDQTQLNEVLTYLETNKIPEQDRKAYLINAYNIFVISGIINAYPVQSPQAIPAFFDQKLYVISGKKYSLNEIEKGLLFKSYQDPGLHFVLVCGAVGCPPIINRAYQSTDLSNQIEAQIKKALNSSFIRINDVDKKIELSEIFKWYASDFGSNTKAIAQYINGYRTEKLPNDYKIVYYPYDWALNDNKTTPPNSIITNDDRPLKKNSLQNYSAGSLLAKGQMDITLFNTLYTQTESNWKGIDYNGPRDSFFTSLAQFTIGTSQTKRFNFGLDVTFRLTGSSPDLTSKGIAPIFDFNNDTNSRVGITSIAPKIKIQPFKKIGNFTMQSSFSIPTIAHPEGNKDLFWADWNRLNWWNQFFYTIDFKKSQLFLEADLLVRFKVQDTQALPVSTPLSVIYSYFLTPKHTLYALTQHAPTFVKEVPSDFLIPADYTSSGLGYKFQLNQHFIIEALYTKLRRAKNGGLGTTFNIGIKYISN